MQTVKSEERHIICRMRGQSEHRDQVKALLQELVEPSRDEPGCLYYDLYQDVEDLDTFYILDGWASDAAVQAHVAHPNVPRVTDQLYPLLAELPQNSLSTRFSDPR